jgi:hypothetical protein
MSPDAVHYRFVAQQVAAGSGIMDFKD